MASLSQDNGETWSAALDTDIPNPGSSLEVTGLRDGRCSSNQAWRGFMTQKPVQFGCVLVLH